MRCVNLQGTTNKYWFCHGYKNDKIDITICQYGKL